jgi:hypothetical protein
MNSGQWEYRDVWCYTRICIFELIPSIKVHSIFMCSALIFTHIHDQVSDLAKAMAVGAS